jgi:sugar phosphate isomerase/epimerase
LHIGVSTSCFLEKHEGYVLPSRIPKSEIDPYFLELQIDRGFTFDDLGSFRVKSIHLPFARYIPAVKAGKKVYLEGRAVNIASIDEKKWMRDYEYCRDVVRLSRGKGIENAILHYGNCTCGGDAFKNPHHRELHWNMELKFLREISRELKATGINLLVENHPYQDRVFKNHATHIQNILDQKVANICLDFPHAFIRHKKFGDEEPMKLIEKFQKHVLEVHLADNDGETNEPLSLGTGKMPWQELTSALITKRDDMLIVVELHTDPKASIDQLTRYLNEGDSHKRKE